MTLRDILKCTNFAPVIKRIRFECENGFKILCYLKMKRTLLGVAFVLANWGVSLAQVRNDSLAEDFRVMAARNFSRYRTVNFSWEMDADHDYSFGLDGKELEKGRRQTVHTLRFSTMLPIVKSHKASLYANVQYNSYNFDRKGKGDSEIFTEDSYDHYEGGLNGSYYASLFKRPLVLSADVFVDGWRKGWGELQGRFVAMMVLKNTPQTSFSVGLMGMTLYSSTPVLPVITYWHRFGNPNLSLDISLPSQMYLRYQMHRQRLSVGASMNADNFYLRSDLTGTTQVYWYNEVVVKPEIHYEYIINQQFYLSARVGCSALMKGGLYTRKRKEVMIADEGSGGMESFLKLERSAVPFFNVGVSYSLFR